MLIIENINKVCIKVLRNISRDLSFLLHLGQNFIFLIQHWNSGNSFPCFINSLFTHFYLVIFAFYIQIKSHFVHLLSFLIVDVQSRGLFIFKFIKDFFDDVLIIVISDNRRPENVFSDGLAVLFFLHHFIGIQFLDVYIIKQYLLMLIGLKLQFYFMKYLILFIYCL